MFDWLTPEVVSCASSAGVLLTGLGLFCAGLERGIPAVPRACILTALGGVIAWAGATTYGHLAELVATHAVALL